MSQRHLSMPCPWITLDKKLSVCSQVEQVPFFCRCSTLAELPLPTLICVKCSSAQIVNLKVYCTCHTFHLVAIIIVKLFYFTNLLPHAPPALAAAISTSHFAWRTSTFLSDGLTPQVVCTLLRTHASVIWLPDSKHSAENIQGACSGTCLVHYLSCKSCGTHELGLMPAVCEGVRWLLIVM